RLGLRHIGAHVAGDGDHRVGQGAGAVRLRRSAALAKELAPDVDGRRALVDVALDLHVGRGRADDGDGALDAARGAGVLRQVAGVEGRLDVLLRDSLV